VEHKSLFQFFTAVWWKTKTCTITKYICHRSGEKHLRSKPKLVPKLIGSIKLDGICPTLLTLKNSTLAVHVCSSVRRHTLDMNVIKKELPHLSLTLSNPTIFFL